MVEETSHPSERENPLRAEKRRKLKMLRDRGIDPYPHNFARTTSLAEVSAQFEHLEIGEKDTGSHHCLAGRLMTLRAMGKAAFFNLQDQSGELQIYLKLEELSESEVAQYEALDLGDFVGVEGFVFRTKKGELSLHAQKLKILCKSLEPLPEKYHGIADIEIKYRHRHLDLITDRDSRKTFETRSKIIREIRQFLDARGFLEVETPVLQPIYGGAAAHPFATHHRALDMQLFLKISPELYLKRLIVGGFEKVYEIGKNFRNEGIDRSHNPEFMMLEYYEAYTDYIYQMQQFEELVCHVVNAVAGRLNISYQGRAIDFTPPWRRMTVYEAIAQYCEGSDVRLLSEQDLFALCRAQGGHPEPASQRADLIMEIFELAVEKHLWQPTFITDFPKEISPLTKSHRQVAGLVERFEPYAACFEIGNSYTELNDPEDQRARLKEQEASRLVDEEAQPMDEDFLHAIETGMPPTGGVGLGVERLIMILTDRHSIRDIIFFPTMKHK